MMSESGRRGFAEKNRRLVIRWLVEFLLGSSGTDLKSCWSECGIVMVEVIVLKLSYSTSPSRKLVSSEADSHVALLRAMNDGCKGCWIAG